MKEWLKKHDVLMRLLAVFGAFLLWFFVMETENPEREVEHREIPVEFVGTSDIFNAYNLTMISGADSTVRVTIKGKSDQVIKLVRSQISVKAYLSQVTEPGVYSIPYEISLPTNLVSVEKKSPSLIEIEVDVVTSKTVPIEVTVEGTAPQDRVYGSPRTNVETITLTGPQTHLDAIESAKVVLRAEGWSDTGTELCAYELIDVDGKVVASPYIAKETHTVRVTLPVKKIVSVPLTMTFTEGGGVTKDMVTAELGQPAIRVMGQSAVVDALSSIRLASVDLTEREDGDTVQLPIDLPDQVEFAPGQSSMVKATLRIDGISTAEVEVPLTIVDLAPEEEKKTIVAGETNTVQERARRSLLRDIKPEDFTAVLELNTAELGTGSYNLQVELSTVLSSAYGVIGIDEYTAIVEVIQPEE